MPIEYEYPKGSKSLWFRCNKCRQHRTVKNTGYIYVGFGKVICLNCATKDEIIERWRELGGRDIGAKEWEED